MPKEDFMEKSLFPKRKKGLFKEGEKEINTSSQSQEETEAGLKNLK